MLQKLKTVIFILKRDTVSICLKNFQSTAVVIIILTFSKPRSIVRHFFLELQVVNEKYNFCLYFRRNFEKTKLIRCVRNVTSYSGREVSIS